MFSRPTPYNREAPIRLKCIAKQVVTRAESWEMVEGLVVAKTNKVTATCALSDGKRLVLAHLKDADCVRVDEGMSYFIKNSNLISRYGEDKLFFTPSTVVYKAANVSVALELEARCYQAIHPNSKDPEEPLNGEDYYTLQGEVVKATKNGPVPIRDVSLKSKTRDLEVSLWRDAATEELTLGQPVNLSHLKWRIRDGKFNSTAYTVVQKTEVSIKKCTVEIVGVSSDAKSGVTILLTTEMDEYVLPPTVWSG
ncbi:uncharacterized protein LOC111190875 [Astyanax mexicanus]|uniref:uncharacterized protein LOC111190875 n=1 Tax=Astyanax mexicanus TaxID=7994 RepID=UPI0020CAAFC3|nr:uncharacterized protein LOC111190875 [Astyanax mexicanus]